MLIEQSYVFLAFLFQVFFYGRTMRSRGDNVNTAQPIYSKQQARFMQRFHICADSSCSCIEKEGKPCSECAKTECLNIRLT